MPARLEFIHLPLVLLVARTDKAILIDHPKLPHKKWVARSTLSMRSDKAVDDNPDGVNIELAVDKFMLTKTELKVLINDN